MVSYENDVLIIPEKYKNMSVSELEQEKIKVLQEINASKRQKKTVKKTIIISILDFRIFRTLSLYMM